MDVGVCASRGIATIRGFDTLPKIMLKKCGLIELSTTLLKLLSVCDILLMSRVGAKGEIGLGGS